MKHTIHPILLLFFIAPLLSAGTGIQMDPNPPAKWPLMVRIDQAIEVTVIKEDTKADIYIYQTPNFEYHSDIKLGTGLVREFSKIFETTLFAVKQCPLGLNPRMEPPRYQVQLFRTREEYLQAGGSAGSGGVYMGAQRKVLVPLESLNVSIRKQRVARGSGEKDNSTLIHEITHQVMHDWLRFLPIWCIEGTAEYFRMIPYRSGAFNCGKTSPKDYAKNLKNFVPIERLLSISDTEWKRGLTDGTGQDNYLSAGLLCYYLVHLDGDGDARRFKNYLKIIAETGNPKLALPALLDGRTPKQLEEELKRAYKIKERLTL